MSTSYTRYKNSRRRLKDKAAVARQVKIAQAHHVPADVPSVAQPHRLVKRHAMNCGNPRCFMCGNPRRLKLHGKDRLTVQERRLFQNTEQERDRHSNGLPQKSD